MTPNRPNPTINRPHSVKFSVDEQLKMALQQLATERHISLSALIRLALTDYLRRKGEYARH